MGGGGYIPVKDMICWTEGLRVGINVLPAGEQGKVRYSYCGKISSYIDRSRYRADSCPHVK